MVYVCVFFFVKQNTAYERRISDLSSDVCSSDLSADQPEVLEIAQEMRRVLAEYPGERLLIGEIYLPVERLVAYYGADLGAVHLPFNFNLMRSEERCVGKECVSTCRARGWTCH